MVPLNVTSFKCDTSLRCVNYKCCGTNGVTSCPHSVTLIERSLSGVGCRIGIYLISIAMLRCYGLTLLTNMFFLHISPVLLNHCPFIIAFPSRNLVSAPFICARVHAFCPYARPASNNRHGISEDVRFPGIRQFHTSSPFS